MEATTPAGIKKLDAGSKKSWKLHQLVDELQKWSAYSQQSAERFEEELLRYGKDHVFVMSSEANAYKDALEALGVLKKESARLKTRSRRLHGPRR